MSAALNVYALLLMGGRNEPFLPAVLKCLEGAVDHVVVHDNSGEARSGNREVLESSSLSLNGRVSVFEAPFHNISQARNECLAYLRERLHCDAHTWLLLIDCDEVHDEGIAFVTRRILPTLPSEVGVVDAYFYNFILSFDFYNALDRRHNLMVRYNDELRWTLDVHEHLHGVAGRRLCLPYTYHHYGYIRTPDHIVEKWKLYRDLGDPTYSDSALADMNPESMFEREVARAMHYTGTYPAPLEVLGDRSLLVDGRVEHFHRLASAHLAHPVARSQAWLRDSNYRLRLFWRTIQWLFERRRLSDARRLFAMLPSRLLG